MGKPSKTRRKHSHDVDPPSTSSSLSPSTSSISDDEETSSSRRRRHKHRRSRDTDDEGESHKRRSSSRAGKGSRKKRKREREKSGSRSEKRDGDRDRYRERKRKERRRRSRSGSKRAKVSDSDSGSRSGSSAEENSDTVVLQLEPENVTRDLLKEFPGVAGDLKQLLEMIDNGQAVDIKGISEKALVKLLNKLFLSLKLKESGDRVFLLRSKARPTLETLGPIISSALKQADPQLDESNSAPPNGDGEKVVEHDHSADHCSNGEVPAPRRRVMGPEMPSAELLAAAAKLTEAEAELREAEFDHDDDLFVGPPPPALVTEVESANDAERFEEVARILGEEVKSPYDILGVNRNMSTDNLKKRYWKMSLMVHPDKCPHPQANQAFVKLNKAFKELQDPDKRKALDDEIKKKEEEEEMKVELKAMREAALWRRSQGISMEGDDILLAEVDVKGPAKRDEWMTTLPPERKPAAMSMHSTFFSKNGKEGRGDTSVWTDNPSDRAQKAKMTYLDAYNQATALAANEDEKKRGPNTDADLVDQYNKAKRSKTLVEKHKEEAAEKSRSKKKKSNHPKNHKEAEEEGWVGNHPWKPWDREKDLTAGRQSVKLDPSSMTEGLTSRFSSGNFQRSFL